MKFRMIKILFLRGKMEEFNQVVHFRRMQVFHVCLSRRLTNIYERVAQPLLVQA